MTGQTIIFGTVMLVTGGVVGYIAGYELAKRKFSKPDEEEDEDKTEDRPEEEQGKKDIAVKEAPKTSSNSPKEETPLPKHYIDYTKFGKTKEELEEDDEEDEPFYEQEYRFDPEEMRELSRKHDSDIYQIDRDSYEAPEKLTGWDEQELYYFPSTNELVDSDNITLSPQNRYVGNVFDVLGFRTNEETGLYVRNESLMIDYWVHKITEATREEIFNE